MLDRLYAGHGNVVYRDKLRLPPRDDVIKFTDNEERYQKEFDDSIQWQDCPETARSRITAIVKQFWDVFTQDGIKRPMRGFQFNIDTGTAKPVSCKPPRYGPHESRAMDKLVNELESNGIVEDDDGPWGSMIVLAAKPNQEHKHWSEYVWRLCVSFRKLNAITRPFTFPTRRCDDAARDIGTSKYFITMDLIWGYWQLPLTEAAKAKTAFFTPHGKKRFTVLGMGLSNAHPAFCAVIEVLKKEWDQEAAEAGIGDVKVTMGQDLQDVGSQNIVDDVILHSNNLEHLLAYFIIVLKVAQHYRVSISLKKTRFLPSTAEFVGLDIGAEGNQPAKSKLPITDAMQLQPPQSMYDLRKFIGFIGFYQEWLPLYELRIGRWRDYQKLAPPGAATREEERELLKQCWSAEDEKLRVQLLDEIRQRATLKRPDFNRRFYLKTDWCALGKAAVLLQADPHDTEAKRLEQVEITEGSCSFDLTLSPQNLRLLPLSFISQRNSKPEQHEHSYTGEAETGAWAMSKFKRFLLGKPFTWLTDCSGLRQFFDGEDHANHKNQRLRMQLLMFEFTIVHRPERMMKEVDTLNRYNMWTMEWRELGKDLDSVPLPFPPKPSNCITTTTSLLATCLTKSKPLPLDNCRIQHVGPPGGEKSLLTSQVDQERVVWVINAATNLAEVACLDAGIHVSSTTLIEDRTELNFNIDTLESDGGPFITTDAMILRLRQQERPVEIVDWIIVHTNYLGRIENWTAFQELVMLAVQEHNLQAIIIFQKMSTDSATQLQEPLSWMDKELGWTRIHKSLSATEFGAAIDVTIRVHISTRNEQVLEELTLAESVPGSIQQHLDPPNRSLDEQDLTMAQQLHALKRRSNTTNMENEAPGTCAIWGYAQQYGDTQWTAIFHPNFPAPDPSIRDNHWGDSAFAFTFLGNNDNNSTGVRGIRMQELLRLYGFPAEQALRLEQFDKQDTRDLISMTAPRELMSSVILGLYVAERKVPDRYKYKTHHFIQQWNHNFVPLTDDASFLVGKLFSMLGYEFDSTTTLPLPSIAAWQAATETDPDLQIILMALQQNIMPERDKLQEKVFHDEYQANRLEAEEGLIHRYEVGKRTALRQVRTKVVPKALRHTVFAALHVSPMAGHGDYRKTYWRIAIRFWWPNMATDVRKWYKACAHCKATNITSHEAQQTLRAFEMDGPFDTMFLDVWSPGRQVSSRVSPKTRGKTHVLTCMDGLTAFAAAAFLETEEAVEAAMAAFQHFFVPYGLPKLVIVDAGSQFAGTLLAMCALLGIPVYQVTRDNHRAILNERFHRYLNKVQRIRVADSMSLSEWLIGTLFAVYAWNSAPVDGTDVSRAVAAIGRDFLFPLDVQQEAVYPRANFNTAEQVIDHLECIRPWVQQQTHILSILQQERRERHRELLNLSKKMSSFAIGDLVVVKKQVQTNDRHGPAKLQISARGPYRVLEQLHEGTYLIQKLPFMEGTGRPGKPYKESAARMTKLPSPLVLHKSVDGIDTRLATFQHALVPHPLENTLGIINYGSYAKARVGSPFAYEPIAQLWPEVEIENVAQEDAEVTTTAHNEVPTNATITLDTTNNGIIETAESQAQEQDCNPASTATAVENEKTTRDKQHNNNSGTSSRKRVTFTDTVDNSSERTATTTRVGRVSRLPKRFRSSYPTAVQTQSQVSPQNKVAQLYQAIQHSRDKLFVIRYKEPSTQYFKWYIAQVQWEDSDYDTAQFGIFTVWFFIRHHIDSGKMPVKDCRYWPEVHSISTSGQVRHITPCRPDRVHKLLQAGKHIVITRTIDLIQHGIVGPFDFTVSDKRHHLIPPTIWDTLRRKARQADVDVNNLEDIIPLR